MLLFATEFPIDHGQDPIVFLKIVREWILATEGTALTEADLEPFTERDELTVSAGDELLRLLRVSQPEDQSVAVGYAREEGPLKWATTLVFSRDADDTWVSVRVSVDARERGVAVPTLQRVLARLEASGLVTARQGSGVVVHDPRRRGELSLLPTWFLALSDQPEQLAGVLDELLGLRRLVAARWVDERGARLIAAAPTLAARLAAVLQSTDLTARVRADLAFTDAVLDASGSFAARTLFRTMERLVEEVPWVAEAMYGDGPAHDAALTSLVTVALQQGGAVAAEAALAPWDTQSVRRFQALMEDACTP